MFAWNLELIFLKPTVMIKGQEGAEATKSIESETDEFGDRKVDRLSKPPSNIYGDG